MVGTCMQGTEVSSKAEAKERMGAVVGTCMQGTEVSSKAVRLTSAAASPKQLRTMPSAAEPPIGSQSSVLYTSAVGGGSREGHFSFGVVRICAPEATAARSSVARACGLRALSSSRK